MDGERQFPELVSDLNRYLTDHFIYDSPDIPEDECESEARHILTMVLRESGHAELVAALRNARMFVADMPTDEADACLVQIDAALKKASAL